MATRYAWVTIARSGDRFAGFAPYVASVGVGGIVAFQAALARGGSGVFAGDGGSVAAVATTGDGQFQSFDSHPDLDAAGGASFYAELASGERGVFVARDGKVTPIACTGDGRFSAIGPLGPTMNDAGTVAFRATTSAGAHGIFTGGERTAVTTVAGAGDRLDGFEGLPVVTGDGAVVFRARTGIYRWRDGTVETVAALGDRFRALGRFPSAGPGGRVAFVGEPTNGPAGVFVHDGGAITTVAHTGHGFASFRGALLDRNGLAVFYATPRGGPLALYTGPDPTTDRLLGLGDTIVDSTLTAFVLNPVSIHPDARLAVRVELANGTEAILRGDTRG